MLKNSVLEVQLSRRGALGVLAVLGAGLALTRPPRRGPAPVHGINVAWFNGAYASDLGPNPFHPEWGVHYDAAFVARVFDDIKALHLNVVRLWLFEGLEGLTFSPEGLVTGIAPTFTAHLEEVLALAEARGLALYLTLLNFDTDKHFTDPLPGGGKVQNFLVAGRAQEQFLANAVRPLCERLKGKKGLYALEVMNELNLLTEQQGLPWSAARALVKAVVEEGHRAGLKVSCSVTGTTAPFAVPGERSLRDLGLDLYDMHWYGDSPQLASVTSLQLDRPALIGEFGPADGHLDQQEAVTRAVLAQAEAGKYLGTLAWRYDLKDNHRLLEGEPGKWRPAALALKETGERLGL